MRKDDKQSLEVNRREIIVGGSALAGVSLFSGLVQHLLAQDKPSIEHLKGHVEAKNGGTKQVYVPEGNTKDPVAISHADILFWSDILSEHGMFFAMLMPGKELATQRGEAESFQAKFAQHFEKARNMKLDRNNYAAFNRETIDAVKPFIDFKHQMHEAQESGKLRSLVWPLFFEHTANEAERFTKRLENLASGNSEYERTEVVTFWTEIMGEHAEFIAHLLDPQEDTLIDKATKTADAFEKLHSTPPPAGSSDQVMKAGEEILAFKETAGKGILAGQIKSIIHPALADHVRREAVKFLDELKRTKV